MKSSINKVSSVQGAVSLQQSGQLHPLAKPVDKLETIRQIIRDAKDPWMKNLLLCLFADVPLRLALVEVEVEEQTHGYASAPSAKQIHKAAKYARLCHGVNADERELLYCTAVLVGVQRFWIYEQGWTPFNAQEEMRAFLRTYGNAKTADGTIKLWKMRLALNMGNDDETLNPTGVRLRKAVQTAWAWIGMGIAID